MCACILIEGLFVVRQITSEPVADQAAVIAIAREWAAGDWSLGGYLKQCPYQCGLVFVIYALIKIFGEYGVFVFKLLNVISICAIYYIFYKRSSKNTAVFNLVIGAIFFPPILYSTYVYGNTMGTALALLGYILWEKYRDIQKLQYFLCFLLVCFLSVNLKGTNNILIMAMIICQFIDFTGTKEKKNLVAMILLVVLTIFANKGALKLAEHLTGEQLGTGSYKISWVVMGMMEQDERRYDGWWNGYNSETWSESNGNIELQKERVDKDLQERLEFFASNPKYAVEFFAEKNASQWNTPTFESFWINTFMGRYIEDSKTWLENRLVEPTMRHVAEYLNIIQSLILGFALIALLFENDKAQLWYILILIGGFIFFTLWEAQASNTLWFFIMLIPLASNGIGTSMRLLDNAINKNYSEILNRKVAVFLLIMIFIAFIGVSKSATIGRIFKGSEDGPEYEEYIQYMSNLTEEEKVQVYHDFP